MSTRQQDIGEYHTGTAENIVLERHAVIDRHVVLYLATVPDSHPRTDHHILGDHATLSDATAGENVGEMPDFRPCSNLHVWIDDRRGMNENIFAHLSSLTYLRSLIVAHLSSLAPRYAARAGETRSE